MSITQSEIDKQSSRVFKSLRIEQADKVAEIVLIGPGPGNAMGPDFWSELPQAVGLLEGNSQVRCVIIRGNGKHFSYGLDLPAMMPAIKRKGELLAQERTEFLHLCKRLQDAISAVELCTKPVIAAVSGWCIGAGLDLISACDIRLCSADALFSLREVKVAMVADLGSLQRLPHIIGQGHTRELAFTGRDIAADRALRIGLVNDVSESPEELLIVARQLAREIAENAPLVVQGAKTMLNDCRDLTVGEGLKRVAVWNSAFLHSPDLEEALTAFQERRPPKF